MATLLNHWIRNLLAANGGLERQAKPYIPPDLLLILNTKAVNLDAVHVITARQQLVKSTP